MSDFEVWFPPVASVLGTMILLFVNRWYTTRDRNVQSSSEIQRARIDDGTVLRKELWDRVTKLEADLQLERVETSKLRARVSELENDLKNTKEDLQTKATEVNILRVQIASLQGPRGNVP